MASLAIASSYSMRVTLPLAMQQMGALSTSTGHSKSCPALKDSNSNPTNITSQFDLYHWNQKNKMVIENSFYLGYILTQLIGGLLAEKYGGKFVLGLCMLLTSTVTVATPLISTVTDGNWLYITATRITIGLCQGTLFPSILSLLGQWAPKSRRTTMVTIAYSGLDVGTLITMLASNQFSTKQNGWKELFYFSGGCGLIWCLFWQLFGYSSPSTHPFLTDDETDFLRDELSMSLNRIIFLLVNLFFYAVGVKSGRRNVPLCQIFASCSVWALIFLQIGTDWAFYILLTGVPNYLYDILRLNIYDEKWMAALPHVITWILTITCGVISDNLINKQSCSVSIVRKFFFTIGNNSNTS